MLADHLSTALRSLRSQRSRSLLTLTSIIIGTLGIVLMASLAKSGLDTLMRSIEELGAARIVLVQSQKPKRAAAKASSRTHGLSLRTAKGLKRDMPHLEAATLFSPLGKRDVISDRGDGVLSDLVAADEGFFQVFHMTLLRGRLFSSTDQASAAPVCVVGANLARRLWRQDAPGRSLSAGILRCRVVGVLERNTHWGMNFGFDWNDLVVVPYSTAQTHDKAVGQSGMVVLVTDSPDHNDIVKRIANARLVAERGNVDNFTFFDLRSSVEKFQSTFRLMQFLVGIVAALALLVGGAGVMNMMLVGVVERTREIGIRKALGASASAIGRQFIIESILLTGLGGLAGVALGSAFSFGAGALLRSFLPNWVIGVSYGAIIVALISSLVIGVVFGFFPARRAAQLSPVVAMKQ